MLFASMAPHAMKTFASDTLDGTSPYELVFVGKILDLTKLRIPYFSQPIKEYHRLLIERSIIFEIGKLREL